MAELEKKLRTLEVSGLWSLPGKQNFLKVIFLFLKKAALKSFAKKILLFKYPFI